MKNRQKITMEEAERDLSVLTLDAKNAIKGGCGHCEGWEEEGATVYSQEEYNYLSSQSLWAGGNVCGIGYVPGTTDTTDAMEDPTTTDDPNTTEDPATPPEELETTGEPDVVPTDDPNATGDNTDSTEDTDTTPPPTEDTDTTEDIEEETVPPSEEDGEEEDIADVEWHTWEEATALMASGEWNGGFVTGAGYISGSVPVQSGSNEGDSSLSIEDRDYSILSQIMDLGLDAIEGIANEFPESWRGVAKCAGVIGKGLGFVGAAIEAYMIYTDENATSVDWASWATRSAMGTTPPGSAILLSGAIAEEKAKEFREQGEQYVSGMEDSMKNGNFFLRGLW